jgi:sulfhydrogenase subunit beta (sulfur reductase)
MSASNQFVLERDNFQQLLEVLTKRGYRVVGPTVRDGAIVYDTLSSIADLPSGWTDEQNGGTYRLRRRNDHALFGYAVGPHSGKKFLHPPIVRLWQARREGDRFEIRDEPQDSMKMAFIGVRSCELHAIAIQDRVFIQGEHVEVGYKSRREQVFIVAVNCGQAGGTCFCTSMKTGPKATSGFDLALTEVRECLHCHLGARSFEEGAVHTADPDLLPAVKANQMSCLASGCHDVVHNIANLNGVKFWKGSK